MWVRVLFAAVLLLAAGASTEPSAQTRRRWVETATNFSGGTFLSFELFGTDTALCRRLCAEHGGCSAYTWTRPPPGGGRAVCELKSFPPGQGVGTPSSRHLSAFKPARGQLVEPYPLPQAEGLPIDRPAGDFAFFDKPVPAAVPVLAVVVRRPGAGGVDRSLDAAFWDGLLFGRAPDSVASYLYEASNHRFQMVKAGVIGPIDVDWPAEATTESRIVQAAAAQGFDFSPYDRDLDGRIGASELVIVAIGNAAGGRGGGARPACDTLGLRLQLVEVCGGNNVVVVGWDSGVAHFAHEIAHTFGARDLYGWQGASCWSNTLTLMSCTLVGHPADPANRQTWDIDPFHKIWFGWSAPRAVRTDEAGTFALAPAQSLDDRPLLLWDARSSRDEFWLLEHRSARLGGIDLRADTRNNVGTADGLVIWYVRYDRRSREPAYYPSVLAGGADGLQSTVGGDDVAVDVDDDRVADEIRPGPNGVLDSTASPRDWVITPAQVFVGALPRANASDVRRQRDARWTAAAPVGTTGIRLAWFDGSDVGVRIDVLGYGPRAADGFAPLMVRIGRPKAGERAGPLSSPSVQERAACCAGATGASSAAPRPPSAVGPPGPSAPRPGEGLRDADAAAKDRASGVTAPPALDSAEAAKIEADALEAKRRDQAAWEAEQADLRAEGEAPAAPAAATPEPPHLAPPPEIASDITSEQAYPSGKGAPAKGESEPPAGEQAPPPPPKR